MHGVGNEDPAPAIDGMVIEGRKEKYTHGIEEGSVRRYYCESK